MTVVAFPKRLPAWVVDQLPWWEQGAYRKGTSTVSLEIEHAVHEVRERLRAITELPELQVFGRLNNPLILHFAFHTEMSVEAVKAETIAIRQALAQAGFSGVDIQTEKEITNE